MLIDNDKSLLRVIKILPVLITILLMLLLVTVVVTDNQRRVEDLQHSLREEFTNQQEEFVKQQVVNVYKQLEYEKSLTNEILENNIRNRVNEAYSIVESIYQANQHRSKQEVTEIIKTTLGSIRFNNSRGYFFIYTMDGVGVLHPLIPSLENKSNIEAQDLHGTYILKEHIALIKKNKEALYRWWFKKPGFGDKEFEKVGIGKYFEPYDWFIGTGEYVVDVDHDIQSRLLSWISEFSYGDNGYVFVINKDGVSLAHRDASLIGNSRINMASDFKRAIELSEDGEAYVHYQSDYIPEGLDSGDKISFVKYFSDWGWILGAGFYTSEIERNLMTQEEALITQNHDELNKLLSWCFLLTLALGLLSLIIGNIIGAKFFSFQKQIEDDMQRLTLHRNLLHEQATHDSLTQLPNRLQLEENIQHNIDLSRLKHKKLAVIFVDLDDFKRVNDRYGHNTGDRLLENLSRKFELILEENESVARFGGDEFIFCIPLLDSIQEAEKAVERISAIFENKVSIENGPSISTSCSIGVAMYPMDGSTSEELIAKSDTVLYRSKAIKKGGALFYDSKINQQVQYEFLLEEEMKEALINQEIYVCYQPQMNAKTGKINSVEALCRWKNALLGQVSPVDFIAIAERTGQIQSIGEFVFKQACMDINSLMLTEGEEIGLSVNVSPSQLTQSDYIQSIWSITQEIGIDPSRITLEITENVLIDDLKNAEPVLHDLRELGFGVSLDDFGTGYSSLSYLHHLPITEIKIDRVFIQALFNSKQTETLVKTMVHIGSSCSMTVVAEGVETKQQHQCLQDLGCDVLQGYLFDKPLEINQLRSRYVSTEIVS